MENSTVTSYVIVSKIPAPVDRYRQSALLRTRDKGKMSTHNTSFPSILEKEEFLFKDNGRGNRQMSSLIRSGSQGTILKKKADDDLDSMDSFATNVSGTSTKSNCEHTNFAKNGTTYSGRLHKYIVHCQNFSETAEYLTPTQRADRSIKRLKSLLQLAKEKLREKEEEIFKLTKEVVELKIFKASVNSRISKKQSSCDLKEISSEKGENSVVNCGADVQNFGSIEDLQKNEHCDTCSDFSPIKNFFYCEETKDEFLKMSPISPHQGLDEKMSPTPDFLLSSLADSGNFDDVASSVSLYSKDSVRFSPDLRLQSDEKSSGEHMNECENYVMKGEQKLKILDVYESELQEKKLQYELELKRVVNEQDEKNFSMMKEFENRLKEEEVKFEERWVKLIQATEEEKKCIINRFERKLAEEKEKYLKILLTVKSIDRRNSVNDLSGESYVRTVEEEKSIYESSLLRIKLKFENEKLLIEKSFDEAMLQEREKFEEKISNLKRKNEKQIAELLSTIAEFENRYKEILPKYDEIVNKNKELEAENNDLKQALTDQEERHKNIYLKLYMKGQEAARLENESKIEEMIEQQKNEVLVPELLVQLKVTQEELENLKDKEYRAMYTDEQGLCLLSSKEAISLWMLAARKAMYKRLAETEAKSSFRDGNAEATLQFLKSAVFYFLTDRDNHLGHLRAIESILGFSVAEKIQIEKSYPW